MKTYLISYDLIRPESSPEYARLINLIKTAVFWAKPLESVWLIKTTLSAMEVAQLLRQGVDSNDRFLVIDMGNDWAGFNLPNDVISWLKNEHLNQ